MTWPGSPTRSTRLAEIALDEADAATARAYASESVVIAGSALILEARDATITLARAAAVDGDPEQRPPTCVPLWRWRTGPGSRLLWPSAFGSGGASRC